MHSITHRILQSTWPKKNCFPFVEHLVGIARMHMMHGISLIFQIIQLWKLLVLFHFGGACTMHQSGEASQVWSLGIFKTDYGKWEHFFTHTHTPKKSINNYPKSPEPSKLPIEDLYTPASYRLSHQKPLEGPIAVFLRVETVIPRSVTWKFNTSPPWSINFPKFPSSKREGGLKSKFFIQGILLMAEIHRNRLRLVFYPIIFRVLTSQVVV